MFPRLISPRTPSSIHRSRGKQYLPAKSQYPAALANREFIVCVVMG
jgi:hypothetical protein